MTELTSEKNATRGKLHEGLLGYYLENGIDNIEKYGFPERPTGKIERFVFYEDNLEFTHRTIVAASAANFILTNHYNNIKKVYWTSNPNDVSVLIGKPTRNPSDLVALLDDGRKIGLSVKLKHSKGLINKANKGAKETDELFNINTQEILQPYKNVLYEAAKIENITIPSENRDSFLRNNSILKNIDKRMKVAGYEKLANVVRDVINKYNSDNISNMIKQGIGLRKDLDIPTYEMITTDRKNSLEHEFVDSYEESERILETHRQHLKLKQNVGRTLTIIGKDDVLICRININSRSSSILSPIQFRWFAWGKEA